MYVKRDNHKNITAISREQETGFTEWLDDKSPELIQFIDPDINSNLNKNSLKETDEDFIRVLEDLIHLLSRKGVIQFTELPLEVQKKLNNRQRLRDSVGDLKLFDDSRL